MLFIFGTRRYVYQLGMVLLVCGRCGNSAAHALRKRVAKFTLFFIPIFPFSTKFSTQCTACGVQHSLTKEQAAQLQTAPQAPQAQPGAVQ